MTLVEPLLRRATFLKELRKRLVVKLTGKVDVGTSYTLALVDRLPRLLDGQLVRLVAIKGWSVADEIKTHARDARAHRSLGFVGPNCVAKRRCRR